MSGSIVHLVGARPNFMKAAPVVRACQALALPQRLVHTGQHYSEALSDIFFRELELPEPDVNLGVGSGSHATQTASTMTALASALPGLDPVLLVLYGDVNSTLAGALVAAKLQLATAHVEAGLRSFDRSMPEEVNRVVVDVLADLLFATSPEAITNLTHEGVAAERIHFVGNPMIDTLLRLRGRFDPAGARARYELPERYGVVTLHRPANVDSADAARAAVAAICNVAEQLPLIIPLHPRGRATLEAAGLHASSKVVHRRADRLPGLHVVGQRGRVGDHGFRRHPGGDDHPGRALPYPAAQHGAPDHDHQRYQSPGHDGRAAGRGHRSPGRARASTN